MWHLVVHLVWLLCAWGCSAGTSYNDGQWHATTTYYPQVYVATTYSTQVAVVTQAANVVVTVTNYVPCTVTQTVYQCQACAPQTTLQPQTPVVQVGVTTETRYTTETPRESYQYQTVTSNGFVLVIANPTAVVQANTNSGSLIHLPTYLTFWVGLIVVLMQSLVSL